MAARTSAVESVGGVRKREGRTELVYPGPKSLFMALMALPPMVVGLSAPTALEVTSGIIAALWFALVPVALYRHWATAALPFVAGGLLSFAVLALPFNAAAFMVDYWSAAVMLILALPKRNRQIVFELPR